ncbi:MAG TPA: pyridoxamine 5'-phosphate oxidase family protein [Acidimicrobiales bacterium]|jgi:hypothetical protein
MTTWHDVELAVPDLAQRAHGILASTTNCVLGSLRRDGSARLSGIDPFFIEGDLLFGSMPDARKGRDLKRDPRMSLHSIPWESRKVRDGREDPGEGDAKLTGLAVVVTDPAAFAAVAAVQGGEHDASSPPDYDLFRVDVLDLVVVAVADAQLVIDRWSLADGRTTVHRD